MAHAATPIPAACITTEDSDLFARMAARNATVSDSLAHGRIAPVRPFKIHCNNLVRVQVVLSLSMEAQNFPPVPSRNIVAEITGSQVICSAHLSRNVPLSPPTFLQFPEQIVMFGGHTDSWDVGQGAQDDGAGFMVSYEALYIIKTLGLKPARTIRLVG
jgi:hypothetical protein